MKIYRSLLTGAVIIFSMLLAGCKKTFLEVPTGNVLLRQTYVVNLQTTQEFLNGVYIKVAADVFRGYNTIYPELIADNIKPATGSTALTYQYTWAQQADETREAGITAGSLNLNGVAYSLYQVIEGCNFALSKAAEFQNEDNAKANVIRGQAYTIRALMHSMLVNTFAQSYNFSADASHPGIAYITGNNWNETATRKTVSEVYALMIKDLEQAIELLPATQTTTLLLNRNAAKALLARLLLAMNNYAAAKNPAREIIASVPLLTTAAGYPDNLFKLTVPAQTEVLFHVAPGPSTAQGNFYPTIFAARYFRSTRQFQATADVASLLTKDPNDVRKNWVSLTAGSWNITKYPMSVVADVTPADGSYFHAVIRSSEMYLVAAESYARLNMEDSARFYLNAIRKRANVSAAVVTVSGSALIDSITTERRKELAFEGFRMYDLLRWKKPVERADAPNPAAKTLSYPNNRSIAPLPAIDVRLSGMQQNPGY